MSFPQLVGIDVGGTFTDFVWLVDGELSVFKESTTTDDQSRAILLGLNSLGVAGDARVVHGTTVATNALLERRGARTALLTTAGFADVLAIGRQNRPHLYRLSQARPEPLVPAELRLEVEERLSASGEVLLAMDETQVQSEIDRLLEANVESVAIVYLYSFLHPEHEQRTSELIRRRAPDLGISLSSTLLPEYREYERTATTVINAYVQPLVAKYLDRLGASLGDRSIHVMQSNGGAIGIEKAANEAARLVLSGPAGGIVGAFEMARVSKENDTPHIMTFDMGGTSTDVALCAGALPRTAESKIADLPLRFPSADIHTVGAGGGSIARVDAGGVLRVGPESAGANPGPACYGRGGLHATVTDANVVLGRLKPLDTMGGVDSFQLDQEAARNVVKAIGDPLDLTTEQAALGIVKIANATMERALRRVSIERGHDPRNYTLIPFGGAGPLHACALAEALGMQEILLPRYPGVLSALGLLMADVSYDTAKALLCKADSLVSDVSPLQAVKESLTPQIQQVLDVGDEATNLRFVARLDMRYEGQSYEIEVPLALPISRSSVERSIDHYHERHQQRYGYRVEDRAVEVVTFRLQGSLPGVKPALPREDRATSLVDQAIVDKVLVWIDETTKPVPRYDRERLQHGHVIVGPAIIVQYDTTVWIAPAWKAEIDMFQNILLQRTEHAL